MSTEPNPDPDTLPGTGPVPPGKPTPTGPAGPTTPPNQGPPTPAVTDEEIAEFQANRGLNL